LELQIVNRDKEIERLHARLDVQPTNMEKLTTEYQIKSAQEKIERLNAQIDFLSRENFSMEDEIKKMKKELSRTDHLRDEINALNATIEDLKKKNDELRKTIREKDTALERVRTQVDLEAHNLLESKTKALEAKTRELQELQERVDSLISENKDLKDKAAQAGQTLSAYHADKKVFSEAIEAVKSENKELMTKIDSLRLEAERKDNEILVLKETNASIQGKVQFLQRENELLKEQLEKTKDGSRENAEAMSVLRQRITDLECDNLRLVTQKNDLQTEIERAARIRQHLEEQVEKLRSDALKTKVEADAGNMAHGRMQTLYEEATKEIENLKREKHNLEVKILDNKRVLHDLELKCTEYYDQLQASKEGHKSLQREINTLNDQLAEKLQELRNTRIKLGDLERDYAELKVVNEKLTQTLEKNKKMRDEYFDIENEKARLLRQIDDNQIEIRNLKAQIDKLNADIEHERSEKAILNERVTALINETENIDANLRKAKEREHEITRLVDALEESKQKERDYIVEIEKLKSDIKKQEQIIANGTKQVDHIAQQKEELLQEIKDLKDEIAILKMNDTDVKTKSIKLQEKINNYEVQIADLKSEKLQCESQIARLEDELNGKKRELNAERTQNGQLTDQVRQLKTLCESLEKTKEELLFRIQTKTNERKIDEDEKNKLNERINILQKRLEEAQAEVLEARNALIDLDRERDALQSQLDEKTEFNAKLKQLTETQDDQLRDMKEKAMEFAVVNDRHIARVQELEAQIRELGKKNKLQHEEITELRTLSELKDTDMQKMTADINLLTRENESLRQTNIGLTQEKERLREALETMTNQEKIANQKLRQAELERDDILNNYRGVCLENERLKRNIDEFSGDNQQYFKKLKDYEREINLLKAQIQQLEIKENQYLNEISSYERNISLLNQRLEQADTVIQQTQAAKDRLLKDYQEIKQVMILYINPKVSLGHRRN